MPFVIKELVLGMISKVIANKLSAQDVEPEVNDLHEKVAESFLAKDSIIDSLKLKVNDLEQKLADALVVQVDHLADSVREQTPWYIDKVVDVLEAKLKEAILSGETQLNANTDAFVDGLLGKVKSALGGAVLTAVAPTVAPVVAPSVAPVSEPKVAIDDGLTDLQRKARAIGIHVNNEDEGGD